MKVEELEKLKAEADYEWNARKKAILREWKEKVSKPSEWLNTLSWMFILMAIVPPALALQLLMRSSNYQYLLPDGSKIISESSTVLIYGNQTLQSLPQYIAKSEIVHSFTIASIALLVLLGIGIGFALADTLIQEHNRKKFIKQYIYEHSKKEN